MKDMTLEQWKEIPGLPRYQVSNKGRIKSFTSSRYPEGKILKPHKTESGYLTVNLMDGNSRGDNKARNCHIHKLVAQAFIPIPEELSGRTDLQVDHIIPVSMGGGITNEDGTFNLRWVTPKQNAWNTLTEKNRNKAVMNRKKMVYQYDENLELKATYASTADAARILGKSQGNIVSSCTGALPRYLGYIWSYVELNDIKDREKLENKAKPQFDKNRKSTLKAVRKLQERYKEEGRLWYQTHKEEMRERCKNYYYKHREEILKKMHDKRTEKRDTT